MLSTAIFSSNMTLLYFSVKLLPRRTCLVVVAFLALNLSSSPAEVFAQTYLNPTAAVDARVADLFGRMNLSEKIAQMIMDIENAVEKAPGIGSYMVGASDPPAGNTPSDWRQRRNELQANNVAGQRSQIPLIMGADAVHGHNILQGATLFSHNIGLGCTRNTALMRRIAQVTATEVGATALDQTFAPTVAVARDMRWGRTYESYSQDTDLVRSYVKPFIQGLQGTTLPYNIVATAKHWVGDGGTTNGEDAGDTALSEADLLRIHGTPYDDAIDVDVGAVMISFSSVNGVQMHENERLITQVLKNEKNFQGFVLSDWQGYERIAGDLFTQIRETVNAGIDLIMAPYQAYAVMDAISFGVENGSISLSRIDDAVRRILRVKFKAGLFESRVDPIDPNAFPPIRTNMHEDTARQAVRESLVLLRNDNQVLPLAKEQTRIFLTGKNADNIRNQCGGWTMSWQGTSSLDRHRIVGGKTVKQGLEMHTSLDVTHSPTGTGIDAASHDVAIVVVGETPYAEGAGDDMDLELDALDKAAIDNVTNAGVPVVSVLISGRPLILDDDTRDSLDAMVAAWLPGTEGDGIAEVLFGDYDFTGLLSFSWPRNIGQLQTGFIGDNPNVLFPFGYGLTYGYQTTESPTQTPTQGPNQVPTKTDRPTAYPAFAPTISPTTSTPEESTTCAANPGCQGLTGECCPTVDGSLLACCLAQPSPPSPPTPSTPPSPNPPTTVDSAACAAYPRCAGLAGDCCPVGGPDGEFLACCDQPPYPTPAYPEQTGLCSVHPRCSDLSGQCCPTETGVMLACCEEESSLSMYQALVDEEQNGGSSGGPSFGWFWSGPTLLILGLIIC